MPPPALLFDMDGVLIDSNPFHRRALIEFCRRKGLELTEEILTQRVFGKTNHEWIPDLFPGISTEDAKRMADEKEAYFREIYADDVEPLAGLIPFLERAKEAGMPMIIGTSAPPENVTFVVEQIGLGPFLSKSVDATRVTEGKPHPQVYLLCAEEVGTEPGRSIVFEDSLVGVQAGVAAGCATVGLSTTHTEAELRHVGASLVIPDFRGLALDQLIALI